MTADVMVDSMGMLLQDPKKKDFIETYRLQCLINAQETVARMLHQQYTTELEYIKTGLTVTAGVTTVLTGKYLGYNVFGGKDGIIKVKDSTTGTWLKYIDIENIKNTENTYFTGTTTSPYYYIWGNQIYVSPTSITSIDVFFKRVPAPLYAVYTMTTGVLVTQVVSSSTTLSATNDHYNKGVLYNITKGVYYYCYDYTGSSKTFLINTATAGNIPVSGNTFYIINNGFETENLSTVTCELNPMFHDIIVQLACAECFAKSDKNAKRNKILNEVIEQIGEYNNNAKKNEGVGTEKENR